MAGLVVLMNGVSGKSFELSAMHLQHDAPDRGPAFNSVAELQSDGHAAGMPTISMRKPTRFSLTTTSR